MWRHSCSLSCATTELEWWSGLIFRVCLCSSCHIKPPCRLKLSHEAVILNSVVSLSYTPYSHCMLWMTSIAISLRCLIYSVKEHLFKYGFENIYLFIFFSTPIHYFPTNQPFHHLHNGISRATEIRWTKSSVHSVGNVEKMDGGKHGTCEFCILSHQVLVI